jgi:hypothetical protein
MDTNPHLKAAILQVVDNQIIADDPPETKQTDIRPFDIVRIFQKGSQRTYWMCCILRTI